MSMYDIFRTQRLHQAKTMAVGKCNGVGMEQRWHEETRVFAEAIFRQLDKRKRSTVLDFGCGPGRLAKAMLDLDPACNYIELYEATDMSRSMREMACSCCKDRRFRMTDYALLPPTIGSPDLIIVSFVLQHVPAVRLYPVLHWLWQACSKHTRLVFINSTHRLAVSNHGFVDDENLGVDLFNELLRGFEPIGELLNDEDKSNPVVVKLLEGELQHVAWVLKAKPAFAYLTEADQKEFDQ